MPSVSPSTLVQGTLDMLVLRTLALEPMHGYGIAQRIAQTSGGVFSVNPGSLFPAFRRLERAGLVQTDWRTSEHNRQAKYSASPRKAAAAWRRKLRNGAARRWPSREFWGGLTDMVRFRSLVAGLARLLVRRTAAGRRPRSRAAGVARDIDGREGRARRGPGPRCPRGARRGRERSGRPRPGATSAGRRASTCSGARAGHAWRGGIRRSPGFAAVVILTLRGGHRRQHRVFLQPCGTRLSCRPANSRARPGRPPARRVHRPGRRDAGRFDAQP